MKLTLRRFTVLVERTPDDPTFRLTAEEKNPDPYGHPHETGWGNGESRFLHHVKKALLSRGYDVLKKRMRKDGHYTDDVKQQYIRDRKRQWYLHAGDYPHHNLADLFNRRGRVILHAEGNTPWRHKPNPAQPRWIDTLIQYKGGGYDGCFWEWNYAYFDQNGVFYSLFHSGRMGCPTSQELVSMFVNQTVTMHSRDVYTYDLARETVLPATGEPELGGWHTFVAECNPDHVIKIGEWFRRYAKRTYLTTCDDCGNSFSVANLIPDGAKGDGGIGIEYTAKTCQGCIDAEEEQEREAEEERYEKQQECRYY